MDYARSPPSPTATEVAPPPSYDTPSAPPPEPVCPPSYESCMMGTAPAEPSAPYSEIYPTPCSMIGVDHARDAAHQAQLDLRRVLAKCDEVVSDDLKLEMLLEASTIQAAHFEQLYRQYQDAENKAIAYYKGMSLLVPEVLIDPPKPGMSSWVLPEFRSDLKDAAVIFAGIKYFGNAETRETWRRQALLACGSPELLTHKLVTWGRRPPSDDWQMRDRLCHEGEVLYQILRRTLPDVERRMMHETVTSRYRYPPRAAQKVSPA